MILKLTSTATYRSSQHCAVTTAPQAGLERRIRLRRSTTLWRQRHYVLHHDVIVWRVTVLGEIVFLVFQKFLSEAPGFVQVVGSPRVRTVRASAFLEIDFESALLPCVTHDLFCGFWVNRRHDETEKLIVGKIFPPGDKSNGICRGRIILRLQLYFEVRPSNVTIEPFFIFKDVFLN